jgi:hypothetical protein
LRGLRPDAGQATQRFGQKIQTGWRFQTERVLRKAV